MIELASKTHKLPAPVHVVWESLTSPHRQGARPWLNLLPDEVEPPVLHAEEPHLLLWSTLWPSRPRDRVRLELSALGAETALTFTLLTPDPPPDQIEVDLRRKRLNHLFGADLRYSYGQ